MTFNSVGLGTPQQDFPYSYEKDRAAGAPSPAPDGWGTTDPGQTQFGTDKFGFRTITFHDDRNDTVTYHYGDDGRRASEDDTQPVKGAWLNEPSTHTTHYEYFNGDDRTQSPPEYQVKFYSNQ